MNLFSLFCPKTGPTRHLASGRVSGQSPQSKNEQLFQKPNHNQKNILDPGNANPPIHLGVILFGLVGLPYLMGTKDSSSEKFSYGHRR